MTDVIAKNLDSEELTWTERDGSKRNAVRLQNVFIGLGTYLPGWKWSEHAYNGKPSEAHVGYVISGRMIIKGENGDEVSVGPGDAFEVRPNHDAWVVGNEPCIALDFGLLKK
jgi:quercetin dioxygenase-like cupin family protein